MAHLRTVTPAGTEYWVCGPGCSIVVAVAIPPGMGGWEPTIRTAWECVHCAGCGRLLRQPPTCVWHDIGPCPPVQAVLTVRVWEAVRDLCVRAGGPLPPAGVDAVVSWVVAHPADRVAAVVGEVWAQRAMWTL